MQFAQTQGHVLATIQKSTSIPGFIRLRAQITIVISSPPAEKILSPGNEVKLNNLRV